MMKKKAYAVSTAHLDTVWRWNLAKTIEEFIPDTLRKNFDLIDRYPEYCFNFEGAFRYELIEEYYPLAFDEITEFVKQGRWYPAGSSYENGDVNIPSPEALFRNILLGNGYFKEKFGIKSKDIFLPDCFGFGQALPSVMKNAGLLGFSTQKLSWGSAYGIPFNLGYWKGSDSSMMLACPNVGSYRYKFDGDIRGDVSVIDGVAKSAFEGAMPYTMHLYGTGDWGGSPEENSVKSVCDSVKANDQSDFEVISAKSDQIFKDIEEMDDSVKASLPVWDNELLMTSHGAGGYTSRAMSKRLNRQCEVMADVAEAALSTADMLGVYDYPLKSMDKAWKRVIRHQFHDDLPGTSLMEVYNDSWNDYHTSLNQFINEYSGAVGAVANLLDTEWVSDCALIVSNPLPKKRREAVSAHVKLSHNGAYVRVYDKEHNEIPSQVVHKSGKEFDIVVLADVEAMGFTVYDVVADNEPCKCKTDLKVSEHVLENSKYRLIFNKNGDIASLADKKLGRQLLDAPIKMAVLHDTGGLNYPSWEMRKKDIDAEPYLYANTPTFEIVENGPARCAIKVSRNMGYSTIVQTVSLSADGEFIRVENQVNWQTRRSMLKAVFPFSCYNKEAVYDLGLGVISRPTNTEKLYEVPAQKWADITAGDGSFGVSVFSDSKYGWDKPSGNTLRLTCIHTPAGAFIKEARQDLQDIGRNNFGFGIFSHSGSFDNGTQQNSEAFSKPLCAFQTTARKGGELTDRFSACSVDNSHVLLRAFKKSQDEQGYIVRFGEADGAEQKGVTFSLYKPIISAKETLADEEIKGDAKVKNGKLIFDMKPYEVKTFFITTEVENRTKEKFKKMDLPYNVKGITSDYDMRNCILQGGGFSLPQELLPQSFTFRGITFKTASGSEGNDLLVARGQTIDLPKGYTKLYILAGSTSTDRQVSFYTDGRERKVTINSMTEKPFVWDMAAMNQTANVKQADIAFEFTHCHHPEGNLADKHAYFFMYEIDIRNAKTLTLPEDNRVVIMAMTAVKKYSNTKLVSKIEDTADGDFNFGDIPPIDKIIDKADFVTIRAGKIQDQAIGGKGKGFKRDNLITNIIRSYTKSEW